MKIVLTSLKQIAFTIEAGINAIHRFLEFILI